jgi:hypothetical protein
MRNNVKAYKLLRRDGQTLKSAMFSHSMTYNKNGLTRHAKDKPKLFVFNSQFAAEKFRDGLLGDRRELWEVEANNVTETAEFGGVTMGGYSFQPGTLFASSIRLIKKIS